MTGPQSPDELLNDLLGQSPADVLAWLAQAQLTPTAVPANFNWLGFSDLAAANARHEHTQDAALAWANIAVAGYQTLMDRAPSTSRHLASLISIMNLRAFLIAQFGATPGDPLLDLQQLIDLFQRTSPLTYVEASHRAASDQKYAPENLGTLRIVKNMLGPFAWLASQGLLQHDPLMTSWVRLRDDLP